MPGFDGTGPRGMGPMTGGGRGYCAVAFNGAGNRPVGRRGFYGRGGGRGFRNPWYAACIPARRVSEEDEVVVLKEQANFLKQQLEDIEARLHAMEASHESDQK
jgi:hypothetical protein